MVIVSCQTKFHAFALSEQLENNGLLTKFFTAYAYQKDNWLRRFVKRVDKENISRDKIKTNLLSAFRVKFNKDDYSNMEYFDKWVAGNLHNYPEAKVFIGWSAMSLNSILAAKRLGLKTIVERGSSHIQYQDRILQEEYKKFGIEFSIDKRVIEKELKEYEVTDFISIPSQFVKRTFVEMGVPETKLIINNYGVSNYFKPVQFGKANNTFVILYLGMGSIRKGLIYLFEALSQLKISEENFEVWFIGGVAPEMNPVIKKYNKSNWHWKGHLPHYELAKWISQCDVAVHPSIEEGLSMVIPQIMACGVPVIATTNTGGEDIIEDGINGFIVPIRSPQAIANKISQLYNDRSLLQSMKLNTVNIANKSLHWDNYGTRYEKFIKQLM